MTNRKNVEEALGVLEQAVKDGLKRKSHILLLRYVFPIITIVASAVSLIINDIGAFVASLGVGGTSNVGAWKAFSESVEIYYQQKSVLENNLMKLRTELKLCGSNRERLEGLGKKIIKFFDAIEEVIKQKAPQQQPSPTLSIQV